ncbi:MAG: TIGR01777 family oxidoreductase [Ignavibacteria bacterium]|jgi:hypothetical protein|nr:TIGR01777 family oxidoreductase [Ignavibacteria bacterium]
MKENIVIFGGTGFLGRKIISELHDSYIITVASRNLLHAKSRLKDYKGISISEFSYNTESVSAIVEGADVVINLSGASIAGRRWNKEYKSILYASRINTTRLIVSSFGMLGKKPRCFISSSATGIYGNSYDEILTETSGAGNDFLANMCIDWENEALQAMNWGIRTVCIRTGVVLDKNEGGFARMVTPFKFFLGGPLGSGKQYMPWIHTEDIVRIYTEVMKNDSLSGIVNGTSPNPVTNKEFSKTLGKILGRPSFFFVPEFALKIIVGELAGFLTSSQRVYPEKLNAVDFTFRYPEITTALRNITN